MHNTTIYITLLFSMLCNVNVYATLHTDSISSKIRGLSGKYLNYYCSSSSDSVFSLCREAEIRAHDYGDYSEKFISDQLYVNASCLKGDIGLGVDIAGRMYEDAKKRNHTLGSALSLQAIGATYMYAGRYHEADSTFSDSEKLMQAVNDPLPRLRLVIQQLHTYMHLENTPQMGDYITKAKVLSSKMPETDISEYLFYIDCYQAVYFIQTKDKENAHLWVKKVLNSKPKEGFFDRWTYYVQSRFYDMTEDTAQALVLCDSILTVIKASGNMNEYKNSMNEKAILLEKVGRNKEACDLYLQIDSLTDSINISHYTGQIDALHTAYWVDNIALENLTAHNRLFTLIITSTIIVALIIIILIVFALRKNRQLEASRKELETERKTAADSIHSKSMFLSNMGHELRTPLNAIVGFSGILTTDDDIDPETKQLCGDNIKQNSELLIKLINDIVDLSDLNGNTIKFTVEKCDVIALCYNVIQTINNIKQTAADITFATDLKTLELSTDKGRLQQVLINLLVNATKFTKEGTITLRLHIDSTENIAVFSVEDTGCGIPLEKQPRIFERFEKLHDNIQGVGLGLSICHLIVTHMGGKIWIDSEYTKGARFVFTHPLYNTSKEQTI